jgi:hypothetical protein
MASTLRGDHSTPSAAVNEAVAHEVEDEPDPRRSRRADSRYRSALFMACST